MNHSFCVGRERRNPDVDRVPTAFRQDPKEEIPMWVKQQFPRDHPVFFTVGSVFSLLRAGFSFGSPSKIVSTPYIYRDELPISIIHFLALDLLFFVFHAR